MAIWYVFYENKAYDQVFKVNEKIISKKYKSNQS